MVEGACATSCAREMVVFFKPAFNDEVAIFHDCLHVLKSPKDDYGLIYGMSLKLASESKLLDLVVFFFLIFVFDDVFFEGDPLAAKSSG